MFRGTAPSGYSPKHSALNLRAAEESMVLLKNDGVLPPRRLPITFYSSLEDLPPFEDYSMANRMYRYFKGMPLYAFGFWYEPLPIHFREPQIVQQPTSCPRFVDN
jgi:beta-glucosidase-like glycosyl hydrolase